MGDTPGDKAWLAGFDDIQKFLEQVITVPPRSPDTPHSRASSPARSRLYRNSLPSGRTRFGVSCNMEAGAVSRVVTVSQAVTVSRVVDH